MNPSDLIRQLAASYGSLERPNYAAVSRRLAKLRTVAADYADRFVDVTDENYDRAMYLSDKETIEGSCLAVSAAAAVFCTFNGVDGQPVSLSDSGIRMDERLRTLLTQLGSPAEFDVGLLDLPSPIADGSRRLTFFEALFHDEF